MKRSELINVLANKFKQMTKEGELQYFYEYEKLANEVVSICENEGMLPPIKKRCPVLLTDKFVWENEEN